MAADAKQSPRAVRSDAPSDASASSRASSTRDGRVTLRYALDDELALHRGARRCRSPAQLERRRARARRRAARRCCTGSPASATSRRRCRRRSAARRARRRPAAARAARGALLRGARRVRLRQRARRRCRARASRAGAGAGAARCRGGGARARGACSCRSAAARTRSWRSRSCAARARGRAVLDRRRRRRSRARSRSPGCRTCSRGAGSTRGSPSCNRAGAINGHVPITAIVSCVALLTAALHGFDAVAMANERSASSGNLGWDGVEVNHQFSKGLRGRAAAARRPLAETGARRCELFSVLRPASELAIARAFARHGALPRGVHELQRDLPPRPRAARRLVVLRLPEVPLRVPRARAVQRPGAPARDLRRATCSTTSASSRASRCSTATGGHKPFECVGEEQESLAAMRLLAADARWRDHRVVRAARRRGAAALRPPARATRRRCSR